MRLARWEPARTRSPLGKATQTRQRRGNGLLARGDVDSLVAQIYGSRFFSVSGCRHKRHRDVVIARERCGDLAGDVEAEVPHHGRVYVPGAGRLAGDDRDGADI